MIRFIKYFLLILLWLLHFMGISVSEKLCICNYVTRVTEFLCNHRIKSAAYFIKEFYKL